MTNSKKRIVILLGCLAMLFIMIIGISYAYYSANVKGNTSSNPSLKLTSGYLSIVYDGGDSKISGGSTSGTTDDLVYTKTFTVTNDGVADAYFGIWIKNYKVADSSGNSTTLSRPQDWTYELKSGDTIIKTGTFPTGDEAIITAYPLAVDETKNLTLTVTFDYITESEGGTDQSADMGKVLSFDVNITQALDNLESAQEGTLLYAIKNNVYSETNTSIATKFIEPTLLNATDYTIPGQASTSENEAIITSTEDDYGISYYYRGNVDNNYVTYSNMCWRIVRVQGDGTIKLVLADWNHPCGTENGYRADDADSAFIADESGNARIDIAYKYNAANDETDFPFTNSDIPPVLSTWSRNTILDISQLVETEWCNDTAMIEEIEDDYGDVYSYYGAYDRLVPISSAKPSLKCNQKGEDNKKSTRYKNILGILSADEVAFAGTTSLISGVTLNYYLKTNASENFYWTNSPYYIGPYDSYVWIVDANGYLDAKFAGIDYMDDMYGAIRPAVVLRSDVSLTTNTSYIQDGTIDRPYVIAE